MEMLKCMTRLYKISENNEEQSNHYPHKEVLKIIKINDIALFY